MTNTPSTPRLTPLREVVAANLRAIIARQQITAEELAERLGRPRQWHSRKMHGKVPITTEDIDVLAEALRVSTDELTDRSGFYGTRDEA